MKTIYLKDGGKINISDYERLNFEDIWVHIIENNSASSKYGTILKSIPVSNIRIIEEEQL